MPDQPISGRPVTPSASGGYSTTNTVRALEHLAAAPHSAPELAAALGVDPRSARTLLQRLHVEGYVVQDVGLRRRYRATLRLVSVGALLLRRATLPRLAAPVLEALAAGGDVTARLWIAGEDRPVCIARVDAAGPSVDAAAPAVDGEPHGSTLVAFRPAPPSPEPVVTVLDARRRQLRSCAFLRHEGGGTAAAAVLDRGVVVAALGLSGALGPAASAHLARAAARIGESLAEATRG